MHVRLLIGLVLVAVVLAACDDDDTSSRSPEQQARVTAERWLAAWQAHEFEAVCALVVADDGGSTCAQRLLDGPPPLRFPGDPRVGRAEITGDTGVVRIRHRGGWTPIDVSLVDGEWFVGREERGHARGGSWPGPSSASVSTCTYDKPPPSPENHVTVKGGATCAEAARLVLIGPALGDLQPHRAADVASRPKIEGDWICQASQPGGPGASLHVTCTVGPKTVRYVFH